MTRLVKRSNSDSAVLVRGSSIRSYNSRGSGDACGGDNIFYEVGWVEMIITPPWDLLELMSPSPLWCAGDEATWVCMCLRVILGNDWRKF